MSQTEHTRSDTRSDPAPSGSDHPTTGSDPREQAAAVAQEARGEAASVAGVAKDELGHVVEEARGQAVGLAHDARDQLHDQARTQTDHLGQAVGSIGEQLQALADGRPEEAGQVRDLTENVAERVQDIARRVDELGFDGSVDELQRFARRRPGVFLAGAAAMGFAVSRLARGAKDGQESSDAASQDNRGTATPRRGEGQAQLPPPATAPRSVPPAAAIPPNGAAAPADLRTRS